jgi:hypothetical protein
VYSIGRLVHLKKIPSLLEICRDRKDLGYQLSNIPQSIFGDLPRLSESIDLLPDDSINAIIKQFAHSDPSKRFGMIHNLHGMC